MVETVDNLANNNGLGWTRETQESSFQFGGRSEIVSYMQATFQKIIARFPERSIVLRSGSDTTILC